MPSAETEARFDPHFPKDMQPTGKSYVGFKGGVAVALGMQFSGKRGLRENSVTLRDFAKCGYDVQTLPHKEAADLLLAGLNDRAALSHAAEG